MKGFRAAVLSAGAVFAIVSAGLAQSVTTTGTLTTYAGPPLPYSGTAAITQAIDDPRAVISDHAGGFYVACSFQNRVYRVASNGILTVIAGTGSPGFDGDGGPAISARIENPTGLAVDSSGNLFIADDKNNRIRKVTLGGIINTIAGGGPDVTDGGPATSASLSDPRGVAVDRSGNVLIADAGHARIRSVTPDGVIHTIAGTGLSGFSGDGGPATSARISPANLVVDPNGNIVIADSGNFRIRKITTDGVINTVAGTGIAGVSADGIPATASWLAYPYGVAVDRAGNIFIAETGAFRIRKVTPAGTITTVAGTGCCGSGGDGGPATAAQLAGDGLMGVLGPWGVDVDDAGNLFIADTGSNRVRKVTPDGVINTAAGNGVLECCGFSGEGVLATSAQLRFPTTLALDTLGNLLFADAGNSRIRKVTPAGIISTVAGTGISMGASTPSGFSGDGGPAVNAELGNGLGVAADSFGNVYIADSSNQRVRKVTPDGVIRTIAGNGYAGFSGDGADPLSAQLNFPSGVAADAIGNVFVADSNNNRIRKISGGRISTVAGPGADGFDGDGGPATAARLSRPTNLFLDDFGNLFILEGYRVRKVTPDGMISTVGAFGNWTAVALDHTGNLFLAEGESNRVQKVTPDGSMSIVAGGGTDLREGVPATSAQLFRPFGVAIDRTGNLFIADSQNNRIRKVTFTQQAAFSMVDRGGVSLQSSGTLPSTVAGYASVQPADGSTTPAGLAIFGSRQNGVLVSEASVPASALIPSGRIYAEINGPVNTGLAIANPNSQPATVSFYFTDSRGTFGNGSVTIPANGQIAKFLNETPFNGPSPLSGTFTFNSSIPVAVVALRGLTNERSEFLITTLPVADLNPTATGGALTFSHIADGGGWTTQIILVNPTDTTLTGTLQFVDQGGQGVTLSGQANATLAYSLAPRTPQKFQTAGTGSAIQAGSVRLIADANTTLPSGVAVFSYRNNGITVTEAGVSAMAAGTAFRLYAESSESIRTGIAVANNAAQTATATLELSRLDGSSTGLTATMTVPGNGQRAVFLDEMLALASLPAPFRGILRVSSSSSISVVGLRVRDNERHDVLITTTPPFNETAAPVRTPLYFPHIADSGGFTTQFILFSSRPGQVASGTLSLFNQAGGAWNASLQ
jgi:sugar lactone lactonase YvrE